MTLASKGRNQSLDFNAVIRVLGIAAERSKSTGTRGLSNQTVVSGIWVTNCVRLTF